MKLLLFLACLLGGAARLANGIEITGTNFVDLGDAIRLKCTATAVGSDSLAVDWFKDGAKMTPYSRVRITSVTSGRTVESKFVIGRAEMRDAGTYVCRSTDFQLGSIKVVVLTAETSPKRGQACQNITTDQCREVLPYTSARFPNFYGARDEDEAMEQLESMGLLSFIPEESSPHLRPFLCSLYLPSCSNDLKLPCRPICLQAQAEVIVDAGHAWPTSLSCAALPSPEFGDCDDIEIKTVATTAVVPSTTSGETFPGGVRVTGTEFVDLGDLLNLTCTATSVGSKSLAVDWFKDGAKMTPYSRVRITSVSSKNTVESRFIIRRAEMSDSGTYVCRSTDRQLSSLKVQVLRAEPGSKGNRDCRVISEDLCQEVLPYGSAKFPNLYSAESEAEALELMQENQLYALVDAQLSPNLLPYLCSLYLPSCSNSIGLPCRPICDQAEAEVTQAGHEWPASSNCSFLPAPGLGDCDEIDPIQPDASSTTPDSTTTSPTETTAPVSPTPTSAAEPAADPEPIVVRRVVPLRQVYAAPVSPTTSTTAAPDDAVPIVVRGVIPVGQPSAAAVDSSPREESLLDIVQPSDSNPACQLINNNICRDILPYNHTQLPNFQGDDLEHEIESLQSQALEIPCEFLFYKTFMCSLYLPPCRRPGEEIILPCRPFCENTTAEVNDFLQSLGVGSIDALSLPCDILPSPDNETCLMYQGNERGLYIAGPIVQNVTGEPEIETPEKESLLEQITKPLLPLVNSTIIQGILEWVASTTDVNEGQEKLAEEQLEVALLTVKKLSREVRQLQAGGSKTALGEVDEGTEALGEVEEGSEALGEVD